MSCPHGGIVVLPRTVFSLEIVSYPVLGIISHWLCLQILLERRGVTRQIEAFRIQELREDRDLVRLG